eukprot:309113-Chlamydomonas_euryale.AAC.2
MVNATQKEGCPVCMSCVHHTSTSGNIVHALAHPAHAGQAAAIETDQKRAMTGINKRKQQTHTSCLASQRNMEPP